MTVVLLRQRNFPFRQACRNRTCSPLPGQSMMGRIHCRSSRPERPTTPDIGQTWRIGLLSDGLTPQSALMPLQAHPQSQRFPVENPTGRTDSDYHLPTKCRARSVRQLPILGNLGRLGCRQKGSPGNPRSCYSAFHPGSVTTNPERTSPAEQILMTIRRQKGAPKASDNSRHWAILEAWVAVRWTHPAIRGYATPGSLPAESIQNVVKYRARRVRQLPTLENPGRLECFPECSVGAIGFTDPGTSVLSELDFRV